MVKGENNMRSLITRLENYVRIGDKCRKIKDLEIQQGRKKKKQGKLEMEGWKTIEKVKKYKYLGYVFQKNGGQAQVWRIGKRRFGRDWGKRILR